MALSEEDVREILHHLEREVRSAADRRGIGGDSLRRFHALASERSRRQDSTRRRLSEQLRAMADGLAQESAYGRTMDLLQRSLTAPHGAPVDGISVSLTPADADLYGVRSVDLGDDPAATVLASELRRIAEAIEHAG